MENINGFSKQLPVGDDRKSWVEHSPNVTMARKLVIHEYTEYVRGNIHYSTEKSFKQTEQAVASKTVVPRSTVERIRVYEWVVLFCGDEVSGREIKKDVGNTLIKQL